MKTEADSRNPLKYSWFGPTDCSTHCSSRTCRSLGRFAAADTSLRPPGISSAY